MLRKILIVEDDVRRVEKLTAWLEPGVRLIEATSAGVAMGLIKRTKQGDLAGVMLDYDLQERPKIAGDMNLSGNEVVQTILEHLPRDVPILVHSMNGKGHPARISKLLEGAGFYVVRMPMATMTKLDFQAWQKEEILDQDEQ